MLATALPSLPPPGTSLLPLLHDDRTSETANPIDGQASLQTQQQQQQRRIRGPAQNLYTRNPLAILANEERILEQRKQAIQTYGYSWLKPAGCNKTMLGRREEEIEREEVERQLREVELQERNAAEVEEAERMAQQEQQRVREDRGEVITGEEGDRDLDDEVPDMDAQDEFDEDEEDEDEDNESDLDDDIPEGDNSYAYDTTRDPDTGSEDSEFPYLSRLPNLPPTTVPRQGHPIMPNTNDQQRAEGRVVANEMADEGELGDYMDEHDLDDDVPDMDEEFRDLDDEVPDADNEEGGWEHTDSELEESDMDISIMPPGATTHQHPMLPPSSTFNQRQRQLDNRSSMASQQSDRGTDLRRSSGNIPLPMAPPSTSAHQPVNRRGLPQSRQLPPNFTPAQLDSDISVSALISTGNTAISSLQGTHPGTGPSAPQRTWLDPASARRNLFGANRLPHTQSFDSSRGGPAPSQASRTLGAIPNLTRAHSGPSQLTDGISRQVSSGGLFTPSPQQDVRAIEEPRSRTRSGRAHGAIRATGGRAG